MNFKSDPQAMILSVLADEPKHGYGIVKAISERSNGVFKLSEGQLYPLLQTMLSKGWVEAEWETPESGPAKKVYRLLPSGTKELEDRMSDWKEFSSALRGVFMSNERKLERGNV